ncbi:hypothetical protein LAJLEIBI_02923 [[Clostridium] hylemonae DSM 15053]|nr:hypothetical protein LAJLEIBI_02923 [[Clostridium] hylemonae DSM 15053]
MGTHFVVTDESIVHDNYKERIIKAKDIDSRVTGRTTGHPVRALRNEMTKKYIELENSGASFEELEHLTLGGLRKAVVDGDVKTEASWRADRRYGERENVLQRADPEAGK